MIVKPFLGDNPNSFQLAKKIYEFSQDKFDKVFGMVFGPEQDKSQTKLISLLTMKSGFEVCGLFEFVTLVRGKN